MTGCVALSVKRPFVPLNVTYCQTAEASVDINTNRPKKFLVTFH